MELSKVSRSYSNSSRYNYFLSAEKTVTLKEDIDYNLLRSMREGEPMAMSGTQRRPPQENDAIPKVAPKWLKHDRQVSALTDVALSSLWFYLLYILLNQFDNCNHTFCRFSISKPTSSSQLSKARTRTTESGSASFTSTSMMTLSTSLSHV